MSGWQALAPEKMTGCKKTQRKPWNQVWNVKYSKPNNKCII
jgi:hypothetical protein